MRAQTAHGRSIRTLLAVALAAVLLPWRSWRRPPPVAAAAAPSTATAAAQRPGEHHPARAERPLGGRRSRASCTRATPSRRTSGWSTSTTPATPAPRPTRHRRVPAGHGAEGGSTDPDYADTCPWPSTRYDLRLGADRRPGRPERPQRRPRRSTTCPPGKYLISVTADGFKIDGAHFTVTGGAPQTVAVRDEPHAAAADDAAHPGLQRQRSRSTAPTRSDAEQGLRGFTAHLTDVLGDGQHRLLRQRAVHRLPAHTNRQRHRPDPLRRQRQADRRHRPARPARASATPPARSSSPTSARTATPPR